MVSLFTKVPIDEAMQVVTQKLQEDSTLGGRTAIPAGTLCELIRLCLTSTYFQLGECFYEQREGAAMGSPLSPVIANLYMEHFERLAVDTSPLQPKLWLRYVDDTFVVWPHGQDALHAFLQHLNGVRDSIQFTMEAESNKEISFLDVLVRRSDKGLSTSVFRKKTHTDRYLNYSSHHHPRVLAGVVKCLRLRAANICDPEYEGAEIAHLRDVFQANGYPDSCIEPILNRKENKQTRLPAEQASQEERGKECTLCLPYVRGVSERIDRLCKSITSVKVRVVFKPIKTLRHMLLNVKNKVPDQKKKGVVYLIPCRECEEGYVGETGRTLQKRIEEHKTAVRRGDEKNGIAVHVKKTNHTINWAEASVLKSEPQYWRRRVVEAVSIQSRQHTMNLDCGLKLQDTWQLALSAHNPP